MRESDSIAPRSFIVERTPSQLPPLERLATAVTYLISPLLLPPVLFGLVLAHFGATPQEIMSIVLGALVLLGFVPLAYLGWMVRHHRALSIEVRDRRRRTAPFLVALAAYVSALVLVLLWDGTAQPLVAAILATSLLNGVILMAITWRWKISIHAANVGGFVSVLWFAAVTWPEVPMPLLHPGWTASLILLVPLVMWARVRVQAHTQAQVWAGALFGLLLPLLELLVLYQAGLLV